MAEFDHVGFNPICEQTKDVRNWSDTKIADEILQSTLFTTLLAKIFIPVVSAFGCFGNVAFFLLLARVKTMRTTYNFYLANLATADLMFLSVETFYHSWRYIFFKYTENVESEPFNTNFGCGMLYFATHVSSLSSILLMTLVSFDRYFAICYPHKVPLHKEKEAS